MYIQQCYSPTNRLSPCTKNSETETKSLWTNQNYVQQRLLPQLPDNTRKFFYIVKRVNGVISIYTCCWQKPSGDAGERQQHRINSSSNGNSSGTPFFQKKNVNSSETTLWNMDWTNCKGNNNVSGSNLQSKVNRLGYWWMGDYFQIG